MTFGFNEEDNERKMCILCQKTLIAMPSVDLVKVLFIWQLKRREARNIFYLTYSTSEEMNQPCWNLIMDFCSPDLRDDKLALF